MKNLTRHHITHILVQGVLLVGLSVTMRSSVYAVNCASVPISGSYTVSSSCSFTDMTDGIDAGTGTTNTAVLSVATSQTLTVLSGQQVAVGSINLKGGGSIVLIGTGSIKLGTPIWLTDYDVDGVPGSTTQILQSTQPANSFRRNVFSSISTADACDGSVGYMSDGNDCSMSSQCCSTYCQPGSYMCWMPLGYGWSCTNLCTAYISGGPYATQGQCETDYYTSSCLD